MKRKGLPPHPPPPPPSHFGGFIPSSTVARQLSTAEAQSYAQSEAAQHLARKQKERKKWKDPTIPFEGTHPQIQIPFIRPRVLKHSAGRSSLYHKGVGFYSTFQPYQAHRFHTCRRKQQGGRHRVNTSQKAPVLYKELIGKERSPQDLITS